MKIASGIVLALVAALFVFWFGWVRAPAPAQVCAHISEVAQREAQQSGMDMAAEGALLQSIQDECIKDKNERIQLRGRLKYRDYALCVTEAETLADISRC